MKNRRTGGIGQWIGEVEGDRRVRSNRWRRGRRWRMGRIVWTGAEEWRGVERSGEKRADHPGKLYSPA